MDEPVLSICNVTKSFGALAACDDVSLDLRPGEIHALIGPNGAGKSTLIKQVSGSLKPDSGTIRFLGVDVTGFDTTKRARMGLGRSFQISSVIPDFTVLQNIMLAMLGGEGSVARYFSKVLGNQERIRAANEYASRVDLQDRILHRAGELAHGERRRLELAMALALRPKAFLLDEPMAGMGPEGSVRMTRLLAGLRHEAPILLVEHDMDAVFALANRISVLVNGKIIASGSVEDIRNDGEVRHAYLGEEDVG
jgi:branched-chain amino acid transport system ATP-binding protein